MQPAIDAGLDASVDAAPALSDDPCAVSASGLRIETCPIPPPCAGVAYGLQLTASGGAAPYSWSATALPAGLSLSVDGLVSGTAFNAGMFSIRVVDTLGTAHEQRYEVTPRNSCWFAYVDNGPSGSVLQLFDPVLSEPGRGIQLPAPPRSDDVQDFEFSPDGRWLAVRSRDAADTDHLALYGAPGWTPIPSALPGSVLHYSWGSPDLGVLAVAYRDGAQTFLSGLRLSRGDVAPDGGASEIIATALPGVPAEVDSQLVWFAGDRLAFHGPVEPGAIDNHALYFTQLSASGFGEVVAYGGTSFTVDDSAKLRLEPVPDGLYTVSTYPGYPSQITAFEASLTGIRRVNHQPDVILSPTGLHVAHATAAGVLEVYLTLAGRDDPSPNYNPSAFVSREGCARLLAWSPAGTELACVRAAGPDSLRIFKLDVATPELVPTEVEGSYAYDGESAVFRRRTFSPAGRWFAFTNDMNLYLADLTGTRLTVERAAQPLLNFDNPYAELVFSPDDRWLLRHQGTNVWLHDLSRDEQGQARSPSSETTLACSETEGEARSAWCGSSLSSTGVSWSPDSRFVAYRVSTDRLLMLSPEHAESPVPCAGRCDQYGFQP